VLITLAIIGVVAAITIPSIVVNHQKKALEAQFAKTYRTLTQAINLSIAEHGEIGDWDWESLDGNGEGTVNFLKTYILSNLNVAKFCESGVKGCYSTDIYKNLKGENWGALSNARISVLLADGTTINFLPSGNTCNKNKTMCLNLRIDINGFKKPNTVGLDYHEFLFFPATNELLPHGINQHTYDESIQGYPKNTRETINARCNKNSDGFFCPARLLLDGFKINY